MRAPLCSPHWWPSPTNRRAEAIRKVVPPMRGPELEATTDGSAGGDAEALVGSSRAKVFPGAEGR